MRDPTLEVMQMLLPCFNVFVGNTASLRGLQGEQHRVKTRFVYDGHGLHTAGGVHLRTPLVISIYALHDAVSVSNSKVCTYIGNDKPRFTVLDNGSELSKLIVLEDLNVVHIFPRFRPFEV